MSTILINMKSMDEKGTGQPTSLYRMVDKLEYNDSLTIGILKNEKL